MMQHFQVPEWEVWVAAALLAILLIALIVVAVDYLRSRIAALMTPEILDYDGTPRDYRGESDRDPLNPEPPRVQDVLFADGHRVTANDVYERGLLPIVDGTGRMVMVARNNAPWSATVEEWCGEEHGARIT